jgi:hypothetical protein
MNKSKFNHIKYKQINLKQRIGPVCSITCCIFMYPSIRTDIVKNRIRPSDNSLIITPMKYKLFIDGV